MGKFISWVFLSLMPIEDSLQEMDIYNGICNNHYGMLNSPAQVVPRGNKTWRRYSPLRKFSPLELRFPASLSNEVQFAIAQLIFEMNKEFSGKTNYIYYNFDGSNYCREKDGTTDVCFFSFPICHRMGAKPYFCDAGGTTAGTRNSKAYNIAITESDIAFNLNGSFWKKISTDDLTPFLVILKHEILHALGFGHVQTGLMQKTFTAQDVTNDESFTYIEKDQIDSWNCITNSIFTDGVPFLPMRIPDTYYDTLEFKPNVISQEKINKNLNEHPYFSQLFDLTLHSHFYAKEREPPMEEKQVNTGTNTQSSYHTDSHKQPSCGVE
jgi:hypothetical protein